MGKNNRQRRGEKQRKQQRRGRGPTHRPHGAGSSHPPRSGAGRPRFEPPPLEVLVLAAADAWAADEARFEALVAALVARAGSALPVLDGLLADVLERLWSRGWTPADVAHLTTRKLSAVHGDLAAALVLADGRARVQRGQPLHPRWEAQLAALAERVEAVELGTGQLRLGVELLGLLSRLGVLPPTVPATGQPAAAAHTAGLDERMLARVRALLAKAEATGFDEEAEALTAKAQELTARYAIDEALLHAHEDVGGPSVRRIPIDDPYADAKAVVLEEVAQANRCRRCTAPPTGG